MSLLAGFNHIATLTSDFDRLIGFYEEMFEVKAVYDARIPGGPRYRHAMLELTSTAALHAFEVPKENVEAAGNEIFRRGRVDHIALSVSDESVLEQVKKRLVASGASSGEIQRFGSVVTLYFEDPDGMGCEVACLAKGQSFADSADPAPGDAFWTRQGFDADPARPS